MFGRKRPGAGERSSKSYERRRGFDANMIFSHIPLPQENAQPRQSKKRPRRLQQTARNGSKLEERPLSAWILVQRKLGRRLQHRAHGTMAEVGLLTERTLMVRTSLAEGGVTRELRNAMPRDSRLAAYAVMSGADIELR